MLSPRKTTVSPSRIAYSARDGPGTTIVRAETTRSGIERLFVFIGSAEQLRRDLALVEGRSLGTPLVAIDEPGMVRAEGGEVGGEKLVHVQLLLDGGQPHLVGRAPQPAPGQARARHPHREA